MSVGVPLCIYIYTYTQTHTHLQKGTTSALLFFSYLHSYPLFTYCRARIYYIEGLNFKLACLAADPPAVPGRIYI